MPEELEGFSLLTNSISDTIGISNSVLWIVLFFFIGLTISIICYQMTKSYIMGSISFIAIGGAGVLIGILPLWIFFTILIVSAITIGYGIRTNGYNHEEIKDEKQSNMNIDLKINSTDIVKMDNSQCIHMIEIVDKVSKINKKDKLESVEYALVEHTKELSLYKRYFNKSQSFKEYWNNLDELLGITTVVEKDTTMGNAREYGLRLWENGKLSICDNYDWFIMDKHPEFNIFKVVGIHKKDGKLNCVYLLGNKDNNPFLFKLDNKHINDDASVEQLLKEYEKSDILKMEMA